MEWKSFLNDLNQNVSKRYDDSVHTLLDRMGLQQKPSTAESILPMLGIFGAGIAVGAALGVLFAPKRGEVLRSDLRHSIEDLSQKGKMRASELVERKHADEGNSRAATGSSATESSAG